MKKIALFIVFVMLFSVTSLLFADDALKKLGRGTANVATCPIEIVYRIGEANKESGPFAAVTWGLVNGVWRTVVRAVVGVYEIVSFPVPIPADYKPVIDDPEFFWGDGGLY